MKLFYYSIIVLILFCGFTSCIVKAPKYTTVEKVLAIKLGSTQEEVSEFLGIPPYNIKMKTDSETVLLYKYRVADRATVPLLLKGTNGKVIRGRYTNLMLTYNGAGKLTKMESCSGCDETKVETKQLDINKVITLITVTLPVFLVYLGIKAGQ